jgi:uncharacterized protein YbcV (DUF1398 family)
MSENSIRNAVQRADRAGSYEEAMRILISAGVRLYHVEVRSHTIVYSSDLTSYTDAGEPTIEEDGAAVDVLVTESIDAAMHAIDHGETDYSGFLRQLWRAGVIEYDVNLIWRRITFSGADGQTYVTGVGTPEKELVGA